MAEAITILCSNFLPIKYKTFLKDMEKIVQIWEKSLLRLFLLSTFWLLLRKTYIANYTEWIMAGFIIQNENKNPGVELLSENSYILIFIHITLAGQNFGQ